MLKHIKALDGVRGTAVLMVIMSHSLVFPEDHLFSAFNVIRSFFWSGVDLFFILSGFLITCILYRNRDGENRFLSFYGRRVLRIFPLYFMVLLVAFGSVAMGYDYFAANTEEKPYLFTFTYNFWLTETERWPRAFAFNHFWSLAIEEQFYLFWPFVVFFVNRRWLWIISLCIVVLTFAARAYAAQNYYWIVPYTNTLTHLDGLALGSFLALCFCEDKHRDLFKKLPGISALVLAGIGLVYLWNQHDSLWHHHRDVVTFAPLALTIVYLWLVWLCLSEKGNIVSKIFSFSVLRFFGKYSYGMYVYHLIILWFMVGKYHFPQYSVQTFLWLMGLTTLLSVVSFHLFEMQFLKLKRFFEYR